MTSFISNCILRKDTAIKKIIYLLRIIIDIDLIYYAYNYFINQQFDNIMIMGLVLIFFLDAVDRFISDEKNILSFYMTSSWRL